MAITDPDCSLESSLLVRVLTQTLKITSIVVLTLLVIAGSVSFFNYWTDREASSEIGRPVTLTITEDDDTGSVADKLTDADLVQYGMYFETRFRLSGDELQPGTYILRRGMSVSEIIDAISVPSADEPDGTVEGPGEAIQVTFPEGLRIEEYAEALVDAGWQGDPAEFIDLAKHPTNKDSWDFMSGSPADASYEGFLFPDTYTIPADTAAQDIIDYLLSSFEANYSDQMRDQTEESGMSIFEVVTLASIVEKEAAVEEERVIIAGLYLNRIEQGMPLQADPTIQYVVGTSDDWWPQLNTALIEQAANDPYNTYNPEVTGLPPGPIANPGIRAIQAVLNPDDNDYLYMQAKNDGSNTHAFTSSLEEHEQNICTYNPEAEICGGGSSDEPTDIDLAWIMPDRRLVNAA